jgi:hypothetical protein
MLSEFPCLFTPSLICPLTKRRNALQPARELRPPCCTPATGAALACSINAVALSCCMMEATISSVACFS